MHLVSVWKWDFLGNISYEHSCQEARTVCASMYDSSGNGFTFQLQTQALQKGLAIAMASRERQGTMLPCWQTPQKTWCKRKTCARSCTSLTRALRSALWLLVSFWETVRKNHRFFYVFLMAYRNNFSATCDCPMIGAWFIFRNINWITFSQPQNK